MHLTAMQGILDQLTWFPHKVSESAPCKIGMRLNSKILCDLMVYQRSVFGMSMKLLVKGAIGDMFCVGSRCRAIRAKVLIFCHLVGNFQTCWEKDLMQCRSIKVSKRESWTTSLPYSIEKKDVSAITAAHHIRVTGPPCKTRLYIPSCIRYSLN